MTMIKNEGFRVDRAMLDACNEYGLIYPKCPKCGCEEFVASKVDDDGCYVGCDSCGHRTLSYPSEEGESGVSRALLDWNAEVLRRSLDDACGEEPIAKIVWLPEDLRCALSSNGFAPSDDNIEVLMASRLSRTIEDLSIERGWEIIEEVIYMVEEELEKNGDADD